MLWVGVREDRQRWGGCCWSERKISKDGLYVVAVRGDTEMVGMMIRNRYRTEIKVDAVLLCSALSSPVLPCQCFTILYILSSYGLVQLPYPVLALP